MGETCHFSGTKKHPIGPNPWPTFPQPRKSYTRKAGKKHRLRSAGGECFWDMLISFFKEGILLKVLSHNLSPNQKKRSKLELMKTGKISCFRQSNEPNHVQPLGFFQCSGSRKPFQFGTACYAATTNTAHNPNSLNPLKKRSSNNH